MAGHARLEGAEFADQFGDGHLAAFGEESEDPEARGVAQATEELGRRPESPRSGTSERRGGS